MSVWMQALVCALLLLSAALTLVAAFGLLRLPHVFNRLHAHAIACSQAGWCVAGAGFIVFVAYAPSRSLTSWLIMLLLSISSPIAVVILGQAAWRRSRYGKRAVVKEHTPS